MGDRKILIWGSLLFCLMVLPCLGEEKEKPVSSLKPVSAILNPDGTLNMRQGAEGSFDPRGFRMIAKPGEAPRFVPAPFGHEGDEGGLTELALKGGIWDDRFGSSGINDTVFAVALSGKNLYIGGKFTTAGGLTVNRIAKWDGTSWSALGSGLDGTVYALAASGTDLYAAGAFTAAGAVSANRIANWDTINSTWSALESGMNAEVYALAVSGPNHYDLYTGGDFTTAGGNPNYHTACWHPLKDDPLGTWDGQGVCFRNMDTGTWTALNSPADLIACGDLYGDGKHDLVGIWSGQVWVKNSANGSWVCLTSAPRDMAVGDMNGDGRADLVGTWDPTIYSSEGVYDLDLVSGAWVQMTSPADQMTAGDLDGDGVDDLIGIWGGQGLWVKYSKTLTWAQITSAARDIAAGKMRGGAWSSGLGSPVELSGPAGSYVDSPGVGSHRDISDKGPGGKNFSYRAEKNLIPQDSASLVYRMPGPGEPGFKCTKQENLFPQERIIDKPEKKDN